MSDSKCARALVELAERDLRGFRGMDDAATFADETAGFLAQQAAEKLLKAWLASMGVLYPLTRDLKALLDLAQSRTADAAQFRDLAGLTPFAVQFRYEFIAEDSAPLDRVRLAARLDALLARVRQELAERTAG